jgi:hypothetical protein
MVSQVRPPTCGHPSCSRCRYSADEPKKVLTDAVARMRASHHHPNFVAIQIVQIGNDIGAVDFLKDLMHGDVGVGIMLLLIMRNLTLKTVGRTLLILFPAMG